MNKFTKRELTYIRGACSQAAYAVRKYRETVEKIKAEPEFCPALNSERSFWAGNRLAHVQAAKRLVEFVRG